MTVAVVVPSQDYEVKIRILHAVDRPIKDISIKELCSRCGISKQTFYRHFDSKYSIGLWYSRFCSEHFLYQAGRTYTWDEALAMHFEMLCKERTFLMYSSAGHVRRQLGDEMCRSAEEAISETLSEFKNMKVDHEISFYIHAFCSVLVDATSKWLSCPKNDVSVGDFIRWLVGCIPRPLYDAINRGM